MNRIAKLAATAAFGIASTQAAQAAFVELNVQGVMQDGSIDTDGLFGDPGADLSGRAYMLTYHFSMQSGPVLISTGVGLRARTDCCQAGAGYNNMRFKDYGIILADQGSAGFSTRNSIDGTALPGTGGLSALLARIGGSDGSVDTVITSSDLSLADLDFDAPFLLNLKGSGGALSGSSRILLGQDDLSMSVTSIASTGAIPEPASWAMMVAGFGLAGRAMRRGKAVARFV